jgi:hypothetical protein
MAFVLLPWIASLSRKVKSTRRLVPEGATKNCPHAENPEEPKSPMLALPFQDGRVLTTMGAARALRAPPARASRIDAASTMVFMTSLPYQDQIRGRHRWRGASRQRPAVAWQIAAALRPNAAGILISAGA